MAGFLNRFFFHFLWLRVAIVFSFFYFQNDFSVAQSHPAKIRAVSNTHAPATIKFTGGTSGDLFGTKRAFIQNIGQYGDSIGINKMGKILFGYEGFDMPILFTAKGLIHLQRKITSLSEIEMKKREKKEKKEKSAKEPEEEEEQKAIDKVITMEWVNANPDAKIIAEGKTYAYHTYGKLTDKAFGYSKITYKELYPGIDVVYYFSKNTKAGFEYSIVAQPGANLSLVEMKYGGNVKSIVKNKEGQLIIKSSIEGILQTNPTCFYGNDINDFDTKEQIPLTFAFHRNYVQFSFPSGYDTTKPVIIDPFITATGSLTGLNAGKAKDVDFDYEGNAYVSGGGSGATTHQLGKFNNAGVLQWTFSGSLLVPYWTFGGYWGGWMVEKPLGNVYMGQGFNQDTGFQVIRLTTKGLYDNYISTINPNFREAWKMLWNCNNSSPQILVAGGGTNSNTNFGVITPPSTTISSLNVTGIPYIITSSDSATGWAQDIVDFIIDPANNNMYTLYGSIYGTPYLANQIYKNAAPYSGTSVAWKIPSGFTSVLESSNRPYLIGFQSDNSANIFAINSSYLYYWDGKNLKTFDKATGASVGTPLVTANKLLMQGGIVADNCNNVFVGEGNGTIKVYKFNGSAFDDAAEPDITIPGFAGRAVYDLAFDESKKLLYASGDGFVTSIDISGYCATTQYKLNVAPDCLTSIATVSVSPVPQTGSSITYVLSAAGTEIATNTNGIFTGLSPNVTYTVVATINISCSGAQATTDFTLPGAAITITTVNTTCGNHTGSITATGSGISAPYTYSINGINFQAGGTFAGLYAGVDTITVKDANGCKSTKVVTILNANAPAITFTNTTAECGGNNGTVTANVSGGTGPYQYSINNITYQSSNFFTGLLPGAYTLTVKDANGCKNAILVNITSSSKPLVTATPAAATCGGNNGTITAFGTAGTPPLKYSINGNIFQSGNVFTNLVPGAYTVTVKDANGCTNTATVTVANAPAVNFTTTTTIASCGNSNGTITVKGTSGEAPFRYSIDGVTFQYGNIFTGLAAGKYNVTVKDTTGCTNIATVTIAAATAPVVTATSSDVPGCNGGSGTITVSVTGGVAPFQYSIDGSTFQTGNILTGLPAGNYIANVKDASGCSGLASIIVHNAAGPSLRAVSTVTSCSSNTGTITAIGTGGTAPLQYSLDGVTYQAGNVFTALQSNPYIVYVRDATNCIATTNVTVENTSGLAFLDANTSGTGCDNSSGFLTASVAGGILPVQYSIDGTTFQTGDYFSNLKPGPYTLTAKDAVGCKISVPAYIEYAPPQKFRDFTYNANCNTNNGIIIVQGVGGIQPYEFSIDGGTFRPNYGDFINLNPGQHIVTIKDSAGCTGLDTVTITTTTPGNSAPTITLQKNNPADCNTNADGGYVVVSASGGQPPYTFTNDITGQFLASDTFGYGEAGEYLLVVKDNAGCTNAIIVPLIVLPPPTVLAAVTNTPCGLPTGTITISGTGTRLPLTYNLNGGPFLSTNTFTGLSAGKYICGIADSMGCMGFDTVEIVNTGGPSLSVVKNNGTCSQSNGTITASGNGGSGMLSYNLNGGAFQNSGLFTGLAPGDYVVSVKDATGCVGSNTSVTIVSPPGPTATVTTQPASCNSNNGSVTVTATGGIAPLKYSINGTTFQSSNIFNNLPPGNYTLYVADSAACLYTLSVFIDNIPLPLATAFTGAATCNNNDGVIAVQGMSGSGPYSFSIDGTFYQYNNTFNNLAAGPYTIYLKDALGCIVKTGVSVANTSGPVITNVVTSPAICGSANGSVTVTTTGGNLPLQYSIDGINFKAANTFTALLPGNYSLYVKDASGCLLTQQIHIDNSTGPQQLTAVVTDAACGLNNGNITAKASGGAAPLQYSIDGITYQAGNTFNNVPANSYTLYVKDFNGCLKTLPLTVLNLPGPTLATITHGTSCGASDGNITVSTSGGTEIITYSKDGVTFQSGNIFFGLGSGTYTITAKDARGCTNSVDATIDIIGATTTPTFNAVAPICSGDALSPLPTTSLNGITGKWSPVLNNKATTTYTFTPNAGQCTTTATLTITVNPNIEPAFNAVAPICSGALLAALPTTSLNGITGTWSPALNNKATTIYTFTPNTGQCATAATLTITVSPIIVPTFNAVAPICSGAVLSALPTTSLNGITGTWSPALNNTATTTYTFTPNTGQCATTATLTITVSPIIVPAFNAVATICSGAVLNTLPTTSLNGITGTWSPALDNTATTIYTFTPNAGQCATSTNLTITVNQSPAIPSISIVQPSCFVATGNVTVTSAITGLTFSFDGAPYTTYPIGGYKAVTPGLHSIAALNSAGCISPNANINVINSSSLVLTLNTKTATCNVNNGSITIAGSGGIAPYQYSINGIIYQSGNVFNALAPGTYNVSIKDANNCINSVSDTIINVGGAFITATSVPAFCGTPNGSITSTGTGGIAPYQYSINGTAYQTNNVFNNLITGSYTVYLKDASGCVSTTAIEVSDIGTVSVSINSDKTAICEGQSVHLNAASANATNFNWSPSEGLNNPSVQNPLASPVVTTTYIVNASSGPCLASDSVTVFVNPLPIANAGNDIITCFGKSIQLQGSGGLTYIWSPTDNLSNANIANPVIISPTEGSSTYYLEVIDANGCTSLHKDTVNVVVTPPIQVFAGKDTSIVINQPLQLNAIPLGNTMIAHYSWSPATGLNNSQIKNPVATIDQSITYLVTASTTEGCIGSDDINIKVFQKADLYVPNAFTPNNDGLNDYAKIFPVGIKTLKYFTIFNRWGQKVFTTTDSSKGWDGTLGGVGQSTNVFLWIAEAIDLYGNVIARKGIVTLIR